MMMVEGWCRDPVRQWPQRRGPSSPLQITTRQATPLEGWTLSPSPAGNFRSEVIDFCSNSVSLLVRLVDPCQSAISCRALVVEPRGAEPQQAAEGQGSGAGRALCVILWPPGRPGRNGGIATHDV